MSDVFFPKLPFEKRIWVVKMVANPMVSLTTFEALARSGIVGLFATEEQAREFATKMNTERKDRRFDYLLDEMVWGLG